MTCEVCVESLIGSVVSMTEVDNEEVSGCVISGELFERKVWVIYMCHGLDHWMKM